MKIDSWYRKIMDMMIRISHLYGLEEYFFEKILKGFTFKYEKSDIKYLVLWNECYANKELEMLLNAFSKGLNLKLQIVDDKITYENEVLGEMFSNSFSLSLKKIILIIKLQNRDLTTKPFTHLYMIVSDKMQTQLALRAINICRLGGLISYFDFSNSIENSVMKAESLNSLFIANVNGENVTVLNTQTGNEEEININEIYPYAISYVRGKSKCSSCKDKEE